MNAMGASFRWWILFVLSLSGILLFKPPLYDILLLATMLFWFIRKRATIPPGTVPACVCLLIYVGVYWLSVGRAVVLGKSLWYASLTTFCALLWFFFVNLLWRYGLPAFHTVMAGYAITSVTGVLFGFAVYVSRFPGRERFLYNDRPKGLFVDANIFGPSLIFVLLYALGRILLERRGAAGVLRWRLCALLMAAGVFMSFSRGAWINAAIGIAIFLILVLLSATSAQFVVRRLTLLILIMAVSGTALYLFFENRAEFADVAKQRSTLQHYDAERFQSHDNAVAVTFDNPLLGIGPAQYIENFHIATHSLYLHVLAENGMIAFVALMLFLAVTISTALTRIRRSRSVESRVYFCAIAAALCATLVNSYVIDTLHWRHFWLLCAFAYMPPARAVPHRAAVLKLLRSRLSGRLFAVAQESPA